MPIIAETFLVELRRILQDNNNPAAQVHAAGTIRNLAAGEQLQVYKGRDEIEGHTERIYCYG